MAITDTLAAAPSAIGTGLVVEAIGKTYRKRSVVKGVSLSLQRGEVAGMALARPPVST